MQDTTYKDKAEEKITLFNMHLKRAHSVQYTPLFIVYLLNKKKAKFCNWESCGHHGAPEKNTNSKISPTGHTGDKKSVQLSVRFRSGGSPTSENRRATSLLPK